MTRSYELRFKIDVFTPDTLPMARLAEYMSDLAAMYGERESVHFVKLEKSSAVLVQRVDGDALPKVRNRVLQARDGLGPGVDAYKRVNQLLREDHAVGEIVEEAGTTIVQFPGRLQPETEPFGPFSQTGTLDGQVIRLGGKGASVPVHLQSETGGTYICTATRDLAKQLGRYIFGPEVRIAGTGRWLRGGDGEWKLDGFSISSFEPLRNEPLSAVVARLRDTPGSDWNNAEDPWSDLKRIRSDDDETQ